MRGNPGPHEIHVNIGEVKVGRNSDILKASLGSCVGIAFLWPQKRVYALAHCLLPESPSKAPVLSGRYVSQAIPSLLALLHIDREHRRQIDAVLVGGGNMTAPQDSNCANLIGHLNTVAAQQILKSYGITLIHQDTGGEAGRKILIFCDTGKYVVQKIPRIVSLAR